MSDDNAASPSGGAAARSETKKPRKKSVTWQGLKLTLPPELPETVLFDIIEVEATDNAMGILRTLRSILEAGDEGQFMQVRYKLEQLGGDADTESLLDGIFGKYGVSLGESSASPGS